MGVDIDAEKLTIARSRLRHDSHVALIHGDFVTVPIHGTYERILFAFNVISEFVDPSLRVQALRRATELLTADGQIVVMSQMHDEHGSWRTTIECIRQESAQLSTCSVQYCNEQTQELVTDQYQAF